MFRIDVWVGVVTSGLKCIHDDDCVSMDATAHRLQERAQLETFVDRLRVLEGEGVMRWMPGVLHTERPPYASLQGPIPGQQLILGLVPSAGRSVGRFLWQNQQHTNLFLYKRYNVKKIEK